MTLKAKIKAWQFCAATHILRADCAESTTDRPV